MQPTPLAIRFAQTDFSAPFLHELASFLPTQRWFTSKGKQIFNCSIGHVLPIAEGQIIVTVKVVFADSSSEMYQLPLAELTDQSELENYQLEHPNLVVFQPERGTLLVDAVPLASFRDRLYRMVREEVKVAGGLQCDAGKVLRMAPAAAPSIVPAIDTSNTAIIYGDQFFFKLFRKLDVGLNPDLELVRYLSEQVDFQHCPAYGGSMGVGDMAAADYLNLGMMSGKVDNQGDAWEYFQQLTEKDFANDLRASAQTIQRAKLLGQRTAEMHAKLSLGAVAGAMLRPETMTGPYRSEITAAAQKLLARQMTELEDKLPDLRPEQKALAQKVLALKDQLNAKLQALAASDMELDLIRIHADYHLGQVLVTEDDFYIIDFEGEPLLSIPERRRKRPALKDVAGMVRSFHYAARGQLLLNPKYTPEQRRELAEPAEQWFEEVAKAYLNAYFLHCGAAAFLPEKPEDRQLLLDLFILEKAVYEVAYELNSRPDWLAIPLSGVLRTV